MQGSGLPSLEIAGLTIGVREGVLVLLVLVAFYIGFVLLRFRRSPPRQPAPQPEPVVTPPAVPPVPVVEPVPPAYAETASHLASELLVEGLERELAQLRDEVEVMRAELAALREDMQQELAHLRATQTVAPIYGDAMQMAAAGYDASMIAERCGIARAEAELVVALARSRVE
ncbi:DUF2802 domain-containing protein [Azonexus sp.]|uniref:DUF2802 domain-containing protein n=1 Tax=Azonexus sp. TaxID=1872668 RepID=UPI0035B1EDB4